MSAYQCLMEMIPETEKNNIDVNLNNSLNELEDKMNEISNEIAVKFYDLKKYSNKNIVIIIIIFL